MHTTNKSRAFRDVELKVFLSVTRKLIAIIPVYTCFGFYLSLSNILRFDMRNRRSLVIAVCYVPHRIEIFIASRAKTRATLYLPAQINTRSSLPTV